MSLGEEQPNLSGPGTSGSTPITLDQPPPTEEEKQQVADFLRTGVTLCTAYRRVVEQSTAMFDLPKGQPKDFYIAHVDELLKLAEPLMVLSPPEDRPQVASMVAGFNWLREMVGSASDFDGIRQAGASYLRRFGTETERAMDLSRSCSLMPTWFGMRPNQWWTQIADRI